MSDAQKIKNIDALLVDLFNRVDPDHIVPDENSYANDRKTQFKAPDHFLFGRRILVERKSLRGDEGIFLERINAVTKDQNEEFVIFGKISANAVFRELNDPERAQELFARKSLNKFEQRIKEARDKFYEHSVATGTTAASRVVVVSEEGGAATDGRLVEWFMGQLFLRRSTKSDKVGLTDSIIYIRDPAHTIATDNGHWFKWVTREKITAEQHRDISFLGNLIYGTLAAHFTSLSEDVRKFGEPSELLV